MCLALVAKEVPSDSSIVDVSLPPHMRVYLQKTLQNTSMTYMSRLGKRFI